MYTFLQLIFTCCSVGFGFHLVKFYKKEPNELWKHTKQKTENFLHENCVSFASPKLILIIVIIVIIIFIHVYVYMIVFNS